MIKKRTHIICCAMFLAVACVGLVACGGGDSSGVSKKIHDRTKWFTEEELSEKGLAGLTAPTGLSGEIKSSDAWFGYSFSQVCPDEATFNANAETYFSYFQTNYAGMFGVPRIEKYNRNTNEYWYIIEQKSNLNDFFDDNPSKLYSFYYVMNNTLENGYFSKGSVWIFEIRYELDTDSDQYKFKMFIESADSTRNMVTQTTIKWTEQSNYHCGNGFFVAKARTTLWVKRW